MLEISFGKNRSDTNWKPEYMEWPEFVEILRKVRRTNETMAEYDVMSKENRDRIKNGRAYVGGFIHGGRRKKENVENRWLITLDADSADENFLLDADLVLGGCAYVIYSTHSWRKDKPKYRVVAPVNRALTPDEYGAVSRKVADKIGMKYFDKTTFQAHRLMYLPSCSKDAKHILEIGDGEPMDADEVLNEYADWTDPSEWPRHPDTDKQLDAMLQKLGEPTDKPGVIGTFCEVYSMTEGIETFLSDVYLPTAHEDRWTYAGGSTHGGMRVYDDSWAYSEHQSDPANTGHCYNIFDLVRIHKFGTLDDDVKENTPVSKYPSHQAMLDFATDDTRVKRLLLEDMQNDFVVEPDEDSWQDELELDKHGQIKPTAKNAELLLRHGDFAGVLAYDAFGNTEVIRGNLPWRKRIRPREEYEAWLGADDKRLQHYMSKKYNINSTRLIQNAFAEVTHANDFHPIREYIESYSWDGKERLETLFIDYLGAEDCHYTRQVTRKMLIAAVKRLYEPGCKFDEMLVLIGAQGIGKSSLLAKLGRKWFSDSLRTFENKEAGEHIQSAWIFEIGELSAMKKSEVEEVKAFLSKTEDRYRVAYDRTVSDFPRKCVFFGTTNTRDFLHDKTGNRRFWPLDLHPEKKKKDHWTELTEDEVGQLWAEALAYYELGEVLEIDRFASDEAERQQGSHMEEDPRTGTIQEWLDTPVGEEDFVNEEEVEVLRDRVCAIQVWTECLGNRKGSMRPWEAKEICDIIRQLPNWVERKGRVRVAGYGQQTVFERVKK